MQAGHFLTVVPQCTAGKNLSDKVLSGALVSDADFSNAIMNNVGAAGATAWECIAVLPFAKMLAVLCAACFHSSSPQLLACVQVTLTKAYAVNANFSGGSQLESHWPLRLLRWRLGSWIGLLAHYCSR